MSQLGCCGAGVRLPILPLTAAGQAVVDQALRASWPALSRPRGTLRALSAAPIDALVARPQRRAGDPNVNRFAGGTPPVLCTLALSLALAGCSSNSLFSGDRVDYRSASTKMNPLEVPPDLAQLARDGRYSSRSVA